MALIGETRQVCHLSRTHTCPEQLHRALDTQSGLVGVGWQTDVGRKGPGEMEATHAADTGQLLESDRFVDPPPQVISRSGHSGVSAVRTGARLDHDIKHGLQTVLETSLLLACRCVLLDSSAELIHRYDQRRVFGPRDPKA
jgi:hypothetical protein